MDFSKKKFQQLSFAVSPKWTICREDGLDWGAAETWEFILCSCSLKPIKLRSGVLAERSTPAAPQSNLSCLEIDHFQETAIDTANLGQLFYQTC